VKLEADPVEVTGDLRQLQEIHRRIFQDVFVWAGQTRTDEIRKSDDYFMSPSVFATDGVKVFTDLAAEDLLAGISTADFIEHLAHHFNQLNASTRSAKAMVALSASSGVKSPSTPVILWIGTELTVQRMLTRRGLQWNAAIFGPQEDDCCDAALRSGDLVVVVVVVESGTQAGWSAISFGRQWQPTG